MFVADDAFLISEWDTKKNEEIDLNPTTLVIGSNKYAFWKCSVCGNEWRAQIVKRGVRGQGCPVCNKAKQVQSFTLNRIKEKGSLTDVYPEIAEEWDFERNSNNPSEVLPGSNKKVYWKCKSCGYSWIAMICKRTIRGQGCPFCSKGKSEKAQQEYIKNQIREKGSLGSNYPELLNEWDYEKNIGTPFDYLSSSNKSFHWKCKICGHEWIASIVSRSKGTGCPNCSILKSKKTLLNKLIKEKGSLTDNAPEIAAEWDYEKNENLIPDNVMLNTNMSVWWICKECGHSWRAAVSKRATGSGCPKCGLIRQKKAAAKPIEGINDLLSQSPALAGELHPTKNGELAARDIAKYSNKKVWWLGKCGHEWQASVGSRFMGSGCPICLKEFKISYPEKAIFYYIRKYLVYAVEENYKAEWLKGKELDIYIPSLRFGIEYDGSNWHKNIKSDKEKNQLCQENNIDLLRIREMGAPDIEYNNIFYINANSEKDTGMEKAISYIFSYIETHYGIHTEYSIDFPNDRSSIYKLMEINKKESSLATLYPEIAKEWHPNKNGKITPEYVNAHTHRKYWWICPLGHEYEMTVKHRVEKLTQCPICSNHRVLKGFNDLLSKRYDLTTFWDYDRNGTLLPSEVMEFSNLKVWWKCEYGHSYQRVISHQTTRNSGCPICKMQIVQSGVNDLETLYPEVAAEWDAEKNGVNKPSMYTPISRKRFNWKCSKCNWTWNISIHSRCILGHGCPKCAKKKKGNLFD